MGKELKCVQTRIRLSEFELYTFYQRGFTSPVEEAYVRVLHETLYRKVELCCIDCSCTLIITEKLEVILIICGCTDPDSMERVPDRTFEHSYS